MFILKSEHEYFDDLVADLLFLVVIHTVILQVITFNGIAFSNQNYFEDKNN